MYKKKTKNNTCQNVYNTQINPQPISGLWPLALGLIFKSQVDMRCDTDFVMYSSILLLKSYKGTKPTVIVT